MRTFCDFCFPDLQKCISYLMWDNLCDICWPKPGWLYSVAVMFGILLRTGFFFIPIHSLSSVETEQFCWNWEGQWFLNEFSVWVFVVSGTGAEMFECQLKYSVQGDRACYLTFKWGVTKWWKKHMIFKQTFLENFVGI